jgi:hypothetical protein
MSALGYLTNRPDEVLDALRRGEIVGFDVATEQIPDFFLLYAIESGLLDELAATFPDPRTQQPEIPPRVILAAGVAGHFAGLYALSQLPYALHSPRLLAQLGVQVTVNEPGNGLSRKGTQTEGPFHGDVVRKLLDLIAEQDQEAKRMPGQSLVDWYNHTVGEAYCRAIGAEPCVHILDCTKLAVNLRNEHYELSGVTSRQDTPAGPKISERGYKLGTLRSLLDEGAVMTAIAWGSIERSDLVVTHDLVRQTRHLHPGDLLLEDRGFLDADTINFLKVERRVDVFTGLRSDMLLLRAAIAETQGNPGNWRPHPTRKNQQIQLVSGLGKIWEGLHVPMNVCVVRFKDKKAAKEAEGEVAQQGWRYVGFATTDLTASATRVIQTYQTRPEIEEDYRQLKGSSWRMDEFCATRLVQILWHVILTLLAYNLFQVYTNTVKGQAFARKTRQRIEREQRRKPVSYLVVCTREAFGVYETRRLLLVLLDLPAAVQQKIRAIIAQKLE